MSITPQPPSSDREGASPRAPRSTATAAAKDGEDSDTVKVGVTMRIFRAEQGENNELAVKMESHGKEGVAVTLFNGDDANSNRTFNFDWAFNQCSDEPAIADTCGPLKSQADIYEEIGIPMLNLALEGRCSTVFAYGQTGSGKTYSMIGKSNDESKLGVIPRLSSKIFQVLSDRQKQNPKNEFEVTLQVVEIYREEIHDLLINRKQWPANGIKAKFGKDGCYHAGAASHRCTGTDDIMARIKFADENRSVGSHAKNPTSSRAHTIYTLDFRCTLVDDASGKAKNTTCRVNLVDLAGSESSGTAQTSGERLAEGNAINQSLTNLGLVIRALGANNAKVMPPFRGSFLTLLLQGALTNGKVTMLAAVSPSQTNYANSIATLQFATEIKKVVIKSKAISTTTGGKAAAGDDSTSQGPDMEMINELTRQIESLKNQLSAAGKNNANAADIEALKAELELHRQQEADLEEAHKLEIEMLKDDGARRAELEAQIRAEFEATLKKGYDGATTESTEELVVPHFVNLSPEDELSERLVYKLSEGDVNTFGTRSKHDPPTFGITGPGIRKRHVNIEYVVNRSMNQELVYLTVLEANAEVFVNGEPVTIASGKVELGHWDRIWLGMTSAFRLNFPGNTGSFKPLKSMASRVGNCPGGLSSLASVGFGALARVKSTAVGGGRTAAVDNNKPPGFFYAETEKNHKERKRNFDNNKDTSSLDEGVVDALKKADMANEMAVDLGADALFKPSLFKDVNGATGIRVSAFLAGARYVWTSDKFNDRFFLISDLWQRFKELESEDRASEFELPSATDGVNNPFVDLEPQLIGTSDVFLGPLRNMMDADVCPPVLSLFGQKVGQLQVSLAALDANGDEGPWDDENCDEDKMSMDPFRANSTDLVGETIQFKLKIGRLSWKIDPTQGEHVQFRKIFIRFKFNQNDEANIDDEVIQSPIVVEATMHPNIDFSHIFVKQVNARMLDYFRKGYLRIAVWGEPIPSEKAKEEVDAQRLPRGWSVVWIKTKAYKDPEGTIHNELPHHHRAHAAHVSFKEETAVENEEKKQHEVEYVEPEVEKNEERQEEQEKTEEQENKEEKIHHDHEEKSPIKATHSGGLGNVPKEDNDEDNESEGDKE